MPGFEPTTRSRNLARLAAERFDVVVVGGGITGAGVAREAALRGLSVALVEARDFASGTSSRSSKLIHGGLRYLAQGEIGLVREAATERACLRRMAPHLAATAPMLVPVYGRTSAGVLKLKLGLALYDKLASVPAAEHHRILSRDETLAVEPTLVRERLQGAALYPEYVTDDARLVLDTLKAAHHLGAVVVNYTRVTALGPRDNFRNLALVDEESGAALTTHARVIVNAAGPWVDAISLLDTPDGRPALHLTKGIHLVFQREDLPARHCVVMRARDGRPVFTVPRGPYVYVGTTDTSYEGPLEEPTVTRDDAAYLFEALARTFANLDLGPRRAVGAWAGLRPLVREEGKNPSEISRKDEIAVSASGLVTVAGGKLTTYRRMAERVLDAAAPLLGNATGPPEGAMCPLAGGDLGAAPDLEAYAASAGVRDAMRDVPAETAARLIAVYGSDAPALVRATAPRGAALAPAGAEGAFVDLAPGALLSGAEVRYAVRCEMARTLTDVLERRSRIALFSPQVASHVAPVAAGIMADELGWDGARLEAEIGCFMRQVERRLAWRDDTLEV